MTEEDTNTEEQEPRIVEYRGHNIPEEGDPEHLLSLLSYEASARPFSAADRLRINLFRKEMDKRLYFSGPNHHLTAKLNLDTGEIIPVQGK